MIQTVNGTIEPKELGITMCHEHLVLDLSPVRGDTDSKFDEDELIIEELFKMKEYGVRSVVEVSCNDMGRDAKRLQKISKACGLHVIAATGFYLEAYHSEKVKSCEVEQLVSIFTKDLLEGIDETAIKAGVIGEVASGGSCMAPSEEKVLKAAGITGKRTGFAVTTHCQGGKLALEQSRLLQNQGMNPEKIILGHLDLANDRAYYENVLKTGVNIGFDTIGKESYLKDEVRADNLMWLLEKGYQKQIVLSQDISRKSYLSMYENRRGYMSVMKHFVPLLLKKGATEESLNQMLVLNPARILDKDNETV